MIILYFDKTSRVMSLVHISRKSTTKWHLMHNVQMTTQKILHHFQKYCEKGQGKSLAGICTEMIYVHWKRPHPRRIILTDQVLEDEGRNV